jgi:hypothetical protein
MEVPALQTLSRKEKSVKSLIQMGQHGHYPLFDSAWVYECFATSPIQDRSAKPLTQKEKFRARKILQRLLAHRSFDRQKTALLALSTQDRELFMRTFFQMVEGKILDESPQIH